jgi:hypothetical protein
MLPPLFPHKRFLRFVRKQARRHGALRTDHRHFSVWCKLRRTHLDQAYSLLAPLYSAFQGRLA